MEELREKASWIRYVHIYKNVSRIRGACAKKPVLYLKQNDPWIVHEKSRFQRILDSSTYQLFVIEKKNLHFKYCLDWSVQRQTQETIDFVILNPSIFEFFFSVVVFFPWDIRKYWRHYIRRNNFFMVYYHLSVMTFFLSWMCVWWHIRRLQP